ncbi:hypothetical protein [Anthocerotibacter panamensis]|uniref:hypothetical protein n=1 Tax=Anthocerotibacter panamensis TaxID=2857077 RepID=UPI001C408BBC|nr:hypothetical protein [Anthocerotibacter panamensis]
MLVIVLQEQLIGTEVICRHCLLADRQGAPRRQGNRLLCGQPLPVTEPAPQYRCRMGFHLAQTTDKDSEVS